MLKLIIDYLDDHSALLEIDPSDNSSIWFQQIFRLVNDKAESTPINYDLGKLKISWWIFLSLRKEIGTIIKIYRVELILTPRAESQLLKSKKNEQTYSESSKFEISYEDIKTRLLQSDWDWDRRPLTAFQLRNVKKLYQFDSAATFSVPGSGKTTEALAYFVLKAQSDSVLLIVCPKNAFISWDEQLDICLPNSENIFIRLRGGQDNIKSLFSGNSRFYIITYQQFARVSTIVGDYLYGKDAFVYLDESHRIKSGRGKIIADSLLNISHLPNFKLILSGTPMPQSTNDLIPQYEFLYPEIAVTSEDVIDKFSPIFVRTTKSELDLPPVNRVSIAVPLNPIQKLLYGRLKYETVRKAEKALSLASRSAYRQLGKSVIRLIELVSNPGLLLKDLSFAEPELLSEVISEGSAPKLQVACIRARQLAKKNKKCIIWTTFRQNVEILSERLSDLNAVFIHGGIDTGDDMDIATREGRIKKFKEDDQCYVLVANPAAASESISLHMVCQHAIYVDRTYNAAHYLQSEDRIHRLGLTKEKSPTIEILISPGSIDENINARLINKVDRMAQALNDNSLSIETIPYDIGDDPEDDSDNIDIEDIKSILDWLRQDS